MKLLDILKELKEEVNIADLSPEEKEKLFKKGSRTFLEWKRL